MIGDAVRRFFAAGARGLARFGRWLGPWLRATWQGARAGLRTLAATRLVRATVGWARQVLYMLRAGCGSAVRMTLTSGAIAVLVLGPLYLFTNRVHAGMIGVRQSQWGGSGVLARDFEPGLWPSLRGWHAWHQLDGRTHYLSFGYETDGAEHPVIDLRTRDGNVVQVSVMVPYRILPGEAHRLVAEGLKGAYPDMVRATARNLLGQELAELTSSDLADTDLRRARCDTALVRLNELLRPFHVRAETIQIHQVFFRMAYETKLQAKQLTRQNALLSEALTLVEEEKRADLIAEEIVAEEKRVRAEMDKQIEQEKADAYRRIAEIKREAQERNVLRRVEADAFFEREVATGKLALDRVEALRDELFQATLATPGGRLFLAREAASKLRIESVVLNSSDPTVPSVLDLDEMVELLLGD